MPTLETQDEKCKFNIISSRLTIFVFEMFGSKCYSEMLPVLIGGLVELWFTSYFIDFKNFS